MPFEPLQAALLAVFPALVIVAGLKDVTSFTIPNWISAVLVLAYAPAALAVGVPLPAIGLSLLVGLAALLASMGMFAFGWIGGGDAKLFAVAALWIGWPAVMPFMLVTGVAGGALALLLLEMRSTLFAPLRHMGPAWVGRLATPGADVPYGVAIAIGALVAFPQSLLVTALTRAA